jgi:hypothetical protein
MRRWSETNKVLLDALTGLGGGCPMNAISVNKFGGATSTILDAALHFNFEDLLQQL